MCNPISWIEADGNVFIITDAEIKSEKGKALIKECGNAQDIWGHDFCRKYYGLTGGNDKEINDFLTKIDSFPKEIKKLLKDFNRNFGEMLRLYVPDLRSLTSADGLTLPKEVSGHIYLNSLTSVEGLTLPEKCGSLYLSSLTRKDREFIRNKYGY